MPAKIHPRRLWFPLFAALALFPPLALGGCVAYDAGGYGPGYAGAGYYGGYGGGYAGGVNVYAPSYGRGGYGGHAEYRQGEYRRPAYGDGGYHGGAYHGGGRSDPPPRHQDRRYSSRD